MTPEMLAEIRNGRPCADAILLLDELDRLTAENVALREALLRTTSFLDEVRAPWAEKKALFARLAAWEDIGRRVVEADGSDYIYTSDRLFHAVAVDARKLLEADAPGREG